MRASTAEKKKQTGADTSLTTTITLRMPLGLLDVVKRRAPEFGMGYQTFIKALVQQGLFYLNENGSLTLAVESLEEERQWRAQQRAAELEVLRANRKAEKEAKAPTPAPIVKAPKAKPQGQQKPTLIVTPETLESKVKHTFKVDEPALVNGSGGGGHDAPHFNVNTGGGGGTPLPSVFTPHEEDVVFTPISRADIEEPLVDTAAQALSAFEEVAPSNSKVDTAALRKALLMGDDKLVTVNTDQKTSTILPPPTEPPVEVPIIASSKIMGAEETAFVEKEDAKRAKTVAPTHEPLTLEDIEAMLMGDSEVSAEVEVVHPTSDVDDMVEQMLKGEQEDVMRAVQKDDDDTPSSPPPRHEPAAEVTDDDLSELLAQL